MAATRPPRRQLANAIRALSMDAVEQAQSGHPGMPTFDITPPILGGPIEIGSLCRTATAPCCCIRSRT